MPKIVSSIIGNRYGKWIVIEESIRDKGGNRLYKCKCDCGNEKELRRQTLINGDSTQCKACGCRKLDKLSDLSGTMVGESKVIKMIYSKERQETHYLVECKCGTQKIVPGYKLRSGKNEKCPRCRVKRHGMSYTPTHKVWRDMKNRCYRPKLKCYKSYGGRGITVCDRWLESFDNFFEDMGAKPESLTLDRINNDGNYEPSNCRWTTALVQRHNQRKPILKKG